MKKKHKATGSKEKAVYTPPPMAVPHQAGLHGRADAFASGKGPSKGHKKAKKKA